MILENNKKNNMDIPIVFAINNNYVKQLLVVITSIMLHCNKKNNYNFFILHSDVDKINQSIVVSYIKSFKNATIQFIDMNDLIKNTNLENFLSKRENYNYISIETYFRFYIPDIFKQYEKVIYLDADIIVLRDISELFYQNIENFYCAAVQDSFMSLHIRNFKEKTAQYPNLTFIDYLRSHLNMSSLKYFNAGILLLNIKNINHDNIVNKLFSFASEKYPLDYQDQDVLNAIMENKVKYIDYKWNCLKGFVTKSKPYIYHYVGPEKPWLYNENYNYNYSFINEWWKIYKTTPYYKERDLVIKQKIDKKTKLYNIKNMIQTIFSIKNNGEYKVLTLLGYKYLKKRVPLKIKVALLIDEYFGAANTAYGGYGFLARKYISKYIPTENIQIDVLLERKKKLLFPQCSIIDNVKVYRLPENEILSKIWLKSQNYDIFLSIEMTYPSYQIMKLVENKKLVLWIQDPRPSSVWEEKRQSVSLIKDPCVTDSAIPKLINNLNEKGLVKFISQGCSLNRLAKMLYQLPEETPIQYLPNPIKLDETYKFDLSKKKKQIIFLGRLEPQKRVWLFCEIAKKMPEYEFFVMGKFFRDKENNKKILLPYLNKNIHNLHFTGHLDGEEKEKMIKESRILLNTSIWEGIPISWLEALQYGTTIISCLNNENIPARFGRYVGEILGDGYDKIDLFIPAIKELMENDELYIKKAESSINYIRKTHNVENFQKSLQKILLESSYA